MFVPVPGDRQTSWPKLRALLGVNRLSIPDAETARAATGYERGTPLPTVAINEAAALLPTGDVDISKGDDPP